jgi:sugar/nucleoside kinase (ribokinase family)
LKIEELDRGYITSARFLHLDGSHLEAALQASLWMREAGKTVVLDTGKTRAGALERVKTLLRNVNVLICGAGFVRGATDEDNVEAACRKALGLGPSLVVETMGEQGCITADHDGVFHTPAFSVPVVDTTGAGDVFHGAYIVAMFHGWDTRRSALFASAAAAMKCGSLGGRAGIPSFDATLGFLRERGIDIRQGGV